MEFESYSGEGITIPEIVSDAADKHGVPHNIAHALIGDIESGYDPYAKNPKSSASGLGQIINKTGKSLGMNITGGPDDDRWHPAINADKSMEYLASLYKETGSWNKALARYGEGPKFARSVLRAAKIAATIGERIEFEPYQAQDTLPEMEFEPYISTQIEQPAIDATSEPLAQFGGQPLIKPETLAEIPGAAKEMLLGGPRSVMIPEEHYQEMAKEAGIDVHPGWSKPWEMISSQLGVGAKMGAAGLVDLYEKLTGPPATDIQKGWMDSVKKMLTVSPEKVGTDLASKILQGFGSAPAGVAEFGGAVMAGGPLVGPAVLGAVKTPGGVVEKVKGAAEYGLLGGALRATGGLPLASRIGAMGAVGGGQAAVAGGDVKDITAGAIVMMALATSGGRKLKEAVDTDTKPADMSKAEWDNVKEAVSRAEQLKAKVDEFAFIEQQKQDEVWLKGIEDKYGKEVADEMRRIKDAELGRKTVIEEESKFALPSPEPPLKSPELPVAAREPEVGGTVPILQGKRTGRDSQTLVPPPNGYEYKEIDLVTHKGSTWAPVMDIYIKKGLNPEEQKSALIDYLQSNLNENNDILKKGFTGPPKAIEENIKRTEAWSRMLQDTIDSLRPTTPTTKMYGGGPETTEAIKAVVDDSANIIRGAPSKIKDAYASIKETGANLWEWYKSPFETKERGFKGILGKYLGARQIAGFENRKFLDKIQTAMPNKVTREGITNWIQAGGDEGILRERVNKSKGTLKAGYETALRLTPEEKAIGAEVSTKFDQYLKEAQDAGILEAGLENYVTGLWERGAHNKTELRNLRSEINAGLLNTNFNYAKKKIYESYFVGEQKGRIPKNKDIAFLLGTYHQSMYEAIAARRAIKAMLDGKADDGLPLVSVSGMGKQITAPEETMPFEKVSPEYDMTEAKGPQAYLIRPKAIHTESADGRRYMPIDHPALRKWKWVSNDPEGKPILLQGDMYVHPDIYKHLKNVLSRSAIREHPVGRAALGVSQNLKGVLLSGLPTPFHQVHLGSHAIFHKINPFTCPEINFKDPIQRKAVEHGLMIYSHNALSEFAEGLQPTGLAQKIPGIGRVTQAYGEYLFQDLIPRFKMKLFTEAYKRNIERYGKKYIDDQIAEISANQSNAAFGELNYKAMGRNPTMQDAFRLLALAPDFLEARLRFAGQSLRPGGREQGTALLRAIIGMYGAGVIGNMLFSDDHKPHWDKPFTAIIGKTRYSLRSVPGDIIHLINDPRSFVYHRLNPATMKPLLEALTQRDVFGRKRDMWDQIGDYFRGVVPIPLQGLVSKGERTLLQGVFQSLGVSSYKYRTATDKIILDYQTDHRIDWSPEEAKKREPFYKAKRDLLKKTEGDKEAFASGLKELRTDFGLTPRRTKNIREQFNDELKYRFDSVKDIDIAIKAYDAGTPQEKEVLRRPLKKKLYNIAIRDPAKFKAGNYKDKLEELRK